MRLFKYISMVAALVLAAGCSDERIDGPNGPVDEGDMLSLNLSVNIGEMGQAPTRAFGDTPDYQGLHLYVAEFDDKGGPLDGNVLTNVYEAEEETLNDDGDIHFKLTVTKSDQPKVLHLIAVPNDLKLDIPYGLEGQVIPSLTVEGGKDAYWARVPLPKGYGSEQKDGDLLKWQTDPNLQGYLTHVPMLRNFAKVTMTTAPGVDNFTLTGFVVLNRASKGTVAPWDSQNTNQPFPAFSDGFTPKSYSEMTYSGYCPVNPGVDGSIIDKSADAADFTTDAKYLYERPASSLYNTVVIFCGTKNGVQGTRYYKLDIGKTDSNMIFEYYNILRNFDYQIRLTSVDGNGYATPEEALSGVVQNNFSFDINTAQMLNISNGKEMLWVNQTTFVVNDPNNTEFTFRYRFMPDVSKQGQYDNSNLKFYTEVDGKQELGILKGSVIKNVGIPTGPDAEGYSSIKITTAAPVKGKAETTSFIIIDPTSGLARTINVVVSNPWEYEDIFEYAGTYNTRAQFYNEKYPIKWDEWENAVGTAQGSAFTLFFVIPNDIPQSMFPLEFVAESRGQNFENNKIGTLFVRTGDSFFPETDGTRKKAIQYVKTVTYADYMSELSLTNPTGTLVWNKDSTAIQHRIRMRFLTIKNLNAGDGTPDNPAYVGTVRVYNKYFKTSSGSDYLDYKITVKNFKKEPWLWGMTSETEPTNPTGN